MTGHEAAIGLKQRAFVGEHRAVLVLQWQHFALDEAQHGLADGPGVGVDFEVHDRELVQAALNLGSVISSVTASKATTTRWPMRTDSTSLVTMLVIMRAPSSSSTTATT